MSKVKTTISIVLYGSIDCNQSSWLEWSRYSKEKLKEIYKVPNYVGIIGEGFKSGKLLQLNRIQSRINKSLEEGGQISSMGFYVLPDNFTQAIFDFEAFIGRTNIGKENNILFTVNKNIAESLNIEVTIEELKNYISFKSGEVFELLNVESPHIYASKGNDVTAFKSLNVIKRF